MKKIIIFGMVLITLMLIGCIKTTYVPEKPVYLNVTHNDLKLIFGTGSNNTDLQKEELFNYNYKGKYVIWNGKVRDLDQIDENKFELDVALKESPWFDIASVTEEYVTVYLDKSQYNKAIILKEGDAVKFSGKFDKYSNTFGLTFYFVDGEILS